MPISGGASLDRFDNKTTIDANVIDTATEPVSSGSLNSVAMYTVANTGTSTAHVVTLQVSPNGTDWFDTPFSITGINWVEGEIVGSELRGKVTTVEGSASTVDVYIIST